MLPVSSKQYNQFYAKMSVSTFSGRMEERYLINTREPRVKTDSLYIQYI